MYFFTLATLWQKYMLKMSQHSSCVKKKSRPGKIISTSTRKNCPPNFHFCTPTFQTAASISNTILKLGLERILSRTIRLYTDYEHQPQAVQQQLAAPSGGRHMAGRVCQPCAYAHVQMGTVWPRPTDWILHHPSRQVGILSTQSWALSVFLNLFNNKKGFFCVFFIKLTTYFFPNRI